MRLILVVENNIEVAEGLELRLKLLGYDVEIVDSGEKFLNRFIENYAQYALITMTALLGDMSGADATRAARKWEKGRRETHQTQREIPILGLTGITEQSILMDMGASGMNLVLFSRPVISLDKLGDALQRCLPSKS